MKKTVEFFNITTKSKCISTNSGLYKRRKLHTRDKSENIAAQKRKSKNKRSPILEKETNDLLLVHIVFGVANQQQQMNHLYLELT